VRGAGATVHDHQGLATSQDFVIDHYAVSIHEAFLLCEDIRGRGLWGGLCRSNDSHEHKAQDCYRL